MQAGHCRCEQGASEPRCDSQYPGPSRRRFPKWNEMLWGEAGWSSYSVVVCAKAICEADHTCSFRPSDPGCAGAIRINARGIGAKE